MKAYANYREIPNRLRGQINFVGNSSKGEWLYKPCEHCSNDPDDKLSWYAVYSFTTLMYAQCLQCKRYWLNRTHYSRTTSRLQNLIKRTYDIK